jgi:hypothetical protein
VSISILSKKDVSITVIEALFKFVYKLLSPELRSSITR